MKVFLAGGTGKLGRHVWRQALVQRHTVTAFVRDVSKLLGDSGGALPPGLEVVAGDAMDADEAVRTGYANRSYPANDLDDAVLAVAERIAGVPHELLQLNKRWVYRAMDAMGARTAIRAATDLGSIAPHVPTIQENMADLRNRIRDAAAGD